MRPKQVIRHAPDPPLAFKPSVAPAGGNEHYVRPAPSSWQELHQRALDWDGKDDAAWLEAFALRIPGNCACTAHWRAWVKDNPPRFGDYFAWTVEGHNAVNARLNKQILTVDQARAIWTQPLPLVPGGST